MLSSLCITHSFFFCFIPIWHLCIHSCSLNGLFWGLTILNIAWNWESHFPDLSEAGSKGRVPISVSYTVNTGREGVCLPVTATRACMGMNANVEHIWIDISSCPCSEGVWRRNCQGVCGSDLPTYISLSSLLTWLCKLETCFCSIVALGLSKLSHFVWMCNDILVGFQSSLSWILM